MKILKGLVLGTREYLQKRSDDVAGDIYYKWQNSKKTYKNYKKTRDDLLKEIDWVNEQRQKIKPYVIRMIVYFVVSIFLFCIAASMINMRNDLTSACLIITFLFAYQWYKNRWFDDALARTEYAAVLQRLLFVVADEFQIKNMLENKEE